MPPKDEGVGLFAEAEERLANFASNLYLTSLCMQTIDQLKLTEQKYEKAVLSGDVSLIEKARNDLQFMEEIIKLTAANYTGYFIDNERSE